MVKKLPKDLDIFSLSTARCTMAVGSQGPIKKAWPEHPSLQRGERTIHKADMHPISHKVPAALHGFPIALACSSLGLDQLIVMVWVDQIPAWHAAEIRQPDRDDATGNQWGWTGTLPDLATEGCMPHAPAAAMDVDDGTHERRDHGAAFNVPPRTSRAPRTVPGWLPWLCGLPQHKVEGVAFRFAHRHALACSIVLLPAA